MTFFYPILDGIRVDLIGYSLSFSSHSFQFCSSSLSVSVATPSIIIGSNSLKLSTSNSHSHFVQTICLNENNFLRWSQFFWMYIKGRDKIGYLTSDTPQLCHLGCRKLHDHGMIGKFHGGGDQLELCVILLPKLFRATLFRCIWTLEISPKSVSYNSNQAPFDYQIF